MGKVTTETLRTASHYVAYLGISFFFISRAVQSYLWLEKNEIGTIYKVAAPGHITYPSITFCPRVNGWQSDNVINEAWKVPKPSLRALTKIKETYFRDEK